MQIKTLKHTNCAKLAVGFLTLAISAQHFMKIIKSHQLLTTVRTDYPRVNKDKEKRRKRKRKNKRRNKNGSKKKKWKQKKKRRKKKKWKKKRSEKNKL